MVLGWIVIRAIMNIVEVDATSDSDSVIKIGDTSSSISLLEIKGQEIDQFCNALPSCIS